MSLGDPGLLPIRCTLCLVHSGGSAAAGAAGLCCSGPRCAVLGSIWLLPGSSGGASGRLLCPRPALPAPSGHFRGTRATFLCHPGSHLGSFVPSRAIPGAYCGLRGHLRGASPSSHAPVVPCCCCLRAVCVSSAPFAPFWGPSGCFLSHLKGSRGILV